MPHHTNDKASDTNKTTPEKKTMGDEIKTGENARQAENQDGVSEAQNSEGPKRPDVASHEKPNGLIFGIGAVVLVALAWVGWTALSPSTPTNPNQNNQTANAVQGASDYTIELQENLQRLKAEMDKLHQSQQQVQASAQATQQSKELQARENQPATVYSATPPNANSLASNAAGNANTSTNTNDGATFAGTGSNSTFGNQSTQTVSVSATRIAHPRYTIASGEFVHAVLETAIDSDLPGMVRAVITRPVYAYVGERPLVPAGSRLIGQYSSSLLQGQDRIMIIWNRIILPNGIAVQINSPGVDSLGRAGQGADSINTHFLARFGEASLLSIIGAGAANVGVDNLDQYNSAAAYRTAIAQSFQQSAGKSLQNTLPQKPTLHIYQGAQINVFVARDLSFYQVLSHS